MQGPAPSALPALRGMRVNNGVLELYPDDEVKGTTLAVSEISPGSTGPGSTAGTMHVPVLLQHCCIQTLGMAPEIWWGPSVQSLQPLPC
jgi:hypothetical protein